VITAFLLLPVTAVLAWLYRWFLPRGDGWSGFDSAVLLVVAALAVAWVGWARTAVYHDAGPIFPELVAAAGAYPIIAGGLAAGLAWRRSRARRQESAE
jgi:hypothetical protein